MGFILLGLLLGGLCFYLFFITDHDFLEDICIILLVFGFALLIMGVLLGILGPIGNEYQPTEFNETVELKILPNYTSEEGPVYLSISASSGNTIYCTQATSEFVEENEEAYDYNKMYGAIIIEEDNCEKPRLVKYASKLKPTFWSFNIAADLKYEFVFYVPKGSVVYDISVKE